jgi:CPA2 family monovalent cation:H+ antiporter-2
MHGAHDFLVALTVVLGVAAATTVVFHRLRQPVVLGYILAGLIVGPHVPIPLVADVGIVQTLSEIGVILLMFALGLEFSLRKLVEVGATAGITAVIQCSIMMWLGFVVGRLFAWTPLESLFAGAIIAISSTTIIAKAFDELGIGGKLRQFVVGVLIVEDLIAILLMAVLTAVGKGSGLSAQQLASTVGRLAFFLAALLIVGIVVVPRAVRWIRHLDRTETTLVAVLGICFGVALLALEVGYSVALGAFIAGTLVAESGEAKHIEHLIEPVRDMFAAIFFVSVGMLIDPAVLARHWGAIAAFTAVVIAGKVLSVTFGAFVAGQGTRTSIQAGMSLAQIGEFSFIIAGLGLSLAATREFLYPIAVSVSAVTTLTTPWLIRSSGWVASFLDRQLPRPIQTITALYGSWLERLRSSPRRGTTATAVKRLLRVLALDAAMVAAIVIAGSLGVERGVSTIHERLGLDEDVSRWAVLAFVGVLSMPFCVGVLRNGRRMGETLAAAALPDASDGATDLAAAPRRALVVTLQIATVTLVAVPVLAVTQPFLPGAPGAAVVAILLIVLGVGFWRSARNLQGHVRAGAQVIVEALARQARAAEQHSDADALAHIRDLLPGIGDPVALRLAPDSPAVGRSLAELNLRGLTGATVLAIWRPEGGAVVPNAREALRPGDVLVLAGTVDCVAAATEMLAAPVLAERA